MERIWETIPLPTPLTLRIRNELFRRALMEFRIEPLIHVPAELMG
jgi:hypothetical protein